MRTYDDLWREHHPRCMVHPDNLEESERLLAQDEIVRVECTCAEESEC